MLLGANCAGAAVFYCVRTWPTQRYSLWTKPTRPRGLRTRLLSSASWNDVSHNHFAKLTQAFAALIKIPGIAVRILTSAKRARYHARLEAWQRAHADELEAERRRRSEHFSVMGKRAFKSPKHPQHPVRLNAKKRARA